MSVPKGVDAEAGPPAAVPLAHVVVALAFLLAGAAVLLVDPAVAYAWAAAVHLLLAGFACLTILGAMTQFVPVWAGASLHSRWLAVAQLALAAPGFAGLAVGLLTGTYWLALGAGLLAAVGLWVFVYNLTRTLARVADPGGTEAHFALALGAFAVVAALGPLLAGDLVVDLLPLAGVGRLGVRRAHATLAVFGAVVPTVVGAIYQLGPMFTHTDPTARERTVRRVETAALPIAVLSLVAGRAAGFEPLARAGGLALAGALALVALLVANRLRVARVEWGPLHVRYAAFAGLLLAWAGTAAVGWWRAPVAALYGHPDVGLGLLAAALGAVLAGSLYHIVPFIVWVRTYRERLGFEPVPMVDDLYDGRVARAEPVVFAVGAVALVAGPPVALVGRALIAVAVLAFVANLVAVVVRHGLGADDADGTPA